MAKIFISYRRSDTQIIVGRIYDRLEAAFGRDNVFKDVFDIPPGKDFRDVVREGVAWCDVMLVIIGPTWLSVTDEDGARRLDQADDFVRIEVKTGLEDDGVVTIPVLVKDATLPRARQMPSDIQHLAYINAITVRNDPDFNRDMARLLETVRTVAATRAPTTPTMAERPRGTPEVLTRPRKPSRGVPTRPTPTPPSKKQSAAKTSTLPFDWRYGAVAGAVLLVLLIVLGVVLSNNRGDGDDKVTQSYAATFALPSNDNGVDAQFETSYPADWEVADAPTEGTIYFGTSHTLIFDSVDEHAFPPSSLHDGYWPDDFMIVRFQLRPDLNTYLEGDIYGLVAGWYHDGGSREDGSDPHDISFGRHNGVGVASWWKGFQYNSYAMNIDGMLVAVDYVSNSADQFEDEFQDLVADAEVIVFENDTNMDE